jgi:hypothetical protein
MSDLHTRMHEIAGPATAPSAATVDADLARGRRALGRRRAAQLAAGSGLVAAAVAAVALTLPGASPGHSTTTTTAGGHSAVATRLVAYSGKQPAGFTLDEVPQNWEVQGVDKSLLTLAPKGAADQDFLSCVGKICISQQSSLPDVPKTDVTVNGKPAVLATMTGDKQPGTLFAKQPSGAYLTIQVWDGLNWSAKQIVEFAAGVHVNPGAGVTVG